MTSADPALRHPIARTTLMLAGCMAVSSAALQLSVALATVTFVEVTGIESLLGLGPALFLSAGAVAALLAGRAMDRFGRLPVLRSGFAAGILGNSLTALGAASESSALVVVALLVVGAGNGIVQLTRTAGGDLYPPERRARGISYVLFGAVFGAVLGPAVFVPLFSGRELSADGLVVPWFAAAAISVVGLVLAFAIRLEPQRVAREYASIEERRARPPGVPAPEPAVAGVRERAQPLGALLRRPGVVPALFAALASYAVMVAVMNLTGHLVTDDRGHEPEAVFPIIAAHIVGMFGLVLVVGDLTDRIGRRVSMTGGLLLIGVSVIVLAWIESVAAIALALFGLGLGWAFSFVAASAQLVDSAAPHERGKLVGFNDLCSSALAASLALGGGFLLGTFGPAALAIAGTVIAVVPALWIVRQRQAETSRDAAALGTLGGR